MVALAQPDTAVGEAIPDVRAGLPGIDLQSEPVLIVGAGPVGMTAALMLAHYGIRSRILDDDNKLSYGSRAIAIHRCTLEVWEKLGCVEPVLAKGLAGKCAAPFSAIPSYSLSRCRRPRPTDCPRSSTCNSATPKPFCCKAFRVPA